MLQDLEMLYHKKRKDFFSAYHKSNIKEGGCLLFCSQFSKELQKKKVFHQFVLFKGHVALYLNNYNLFIDIKKEKFVWPDEYRSTSFSLTPIKNLCWIEQYNKMLDLHPGFRYRTLLWYLESLQHLPFFSSLWINVVVKLVRVDKVDDAEIFLRHANITDDSRVENICKKVIQKAKKNPLFKKAIYKNMPNRLMGNMIEFFDILFYKKKCESFLYNYMNKHFGYKNSY